MERVQKKNRASVGGSIIISHEGEGVLESKGWTTSPSYKNLDLESYMVDVVKELSRDCSEGRM